MDSNFLFVYGTLQKDFDNEMSIFLASNSNFIGKGYFLGKLYEISWYPGAVLSKNSNERVYGSVFRLKNKTLIFEKLDDYEGVGKHFPKPNTFKKELVTTYLENESPIETWTYLYNLPVINFKLIASGHYLKTV